MSGQTPHYLLFSDSGRRTDSVAGRMGTWRFVLEDVNGSSVVEAADAEPGAWGERLELLAVVRGLEALNQPSRVTLVTPSRYVDRGLRHGLQEWRNNQWRWERFGKLVPVKNRDLWQRVDRALHYHRVECRRYAFEASYDDFSERNESKSVHAVRTGSRGNRASWFVRLGIRLRRWTASLAAARRHVTLAAP